MKLIKPYFELIEQQPGEVGMLKHIETCGRVAWRSEDRITDDSYIKFIGMLKGVNHGSVLEHGTVYLKGITENNEWDKYDNNEYSIVKRREVGYPHPICYVTTNYRVLQDNNWLDDLKYQCEPTVFHEKRVTVRLVIDRGVSHEFVRHRTMSFTQESSRYCNYSKDKFGNELTFIIPCWLDIPEGKYDDNFELLMKCSSLKSNIDSDIMGFLSIINGTQWFYFDLLEKGWKPQQARAVLPNSLKTELIMTGFISDWKHFFMLRCAPGAHPQAQEIAIPLEQEFKQLGLL